MMKESLSDHIKGAIKEYGSDIIKDGRIISILADYNAYRDNQVYQGMLKTWRDNQAMLEKLYVTLMNKDELELDNLKNYMVNALGQDKSRVDYLVECFRYGVGMSKTQPIYSSTYNVTDNQGQSSQTTSNGTTKSTSTMFQSIFGNNKQSSSQPSNASNSVTMQANGTLPNSNNGGNQPTCGNGIRYVDLGLSVLWADCNFQASQPGKKGGSMLFYEAKNNAKVELPTHNECIEMLNKCSFVLMERKQGQTYDEYKIVGPNGKSIIVPEGFYWTADTESATSDNAYIIQFQDYGILVTSMAKNRYLLARSVLRKQSNNNIFTASPLITSIVIMALCGILLDCFFSFPLWVEILYGVIGFGLVWCVKNKDFEALRDAIKK